LVVVVIVGAVISGIAYATLRGAGPAKTGPQNATTWQPAAFGPAATEGPAPGGWEPPSLHPDRPLEPLPPPRRLRAVSLLSVWVVVIGAGAAALIGVATFLVAHAVNTALGS
jgi:hypothetical protein